MADWKCISKIVHQNKSNGLFATGHTSATQSQ